MMLSLLLSSCCYRAYIACLAPGNLHDARAILQSLCSCQRALLDVSGRTFLYSYTEIQGVEMGPITQVRQAAAGFVEAHERTLERILSEAASPGSKGWQPGDQELEAAALLLQLLARLVPYHQKHPSTAAIDLRVKAYQCVAHNLLINFYLKPGLHIVIIAMHMSLYF